MKSLQHHDYRQAAGRFRAILETYPRERPLLDRVRVYLDLCERELRQRPAPPRTIEERLTLATAALNDGDEATAERLSGEVLSESPDHDLALYLLAAVRARQGESQAALKLLRHALEVSPDVQAQARHDPDFDILRDDEEFRSLLDASGSADRPGNGRRARRGTSR
jgi:hypothetical protein